MASLKRLEGDARHLAGDVCEIAEDLADDAGLGEAAATGPSTTCSTARTCWAGARWASAFFTLAALGGLSLLGTHGVWYLAWYVPPSLPPLWWKLGMGLRWLAAPVGLGPAAYEELARARLAPRDPLAALGRFLAAARGDAGGGRRRQRTAPRRRPSRLAVFGVKRFARRAKALPPARNLAEVRRTEERLRDVRFETGDGCCGDRRQIELVGRRAAAVAGAAVFLLVAAGLGEATIWLGPSLEAWGCDDTLSPAAADLLRDAGNAATDGLRAAGAPPELAGGDARALRQLERLLPTALDWAQRRGSRGKVPMPLTFTEGENGYLAGWWTTRVVAYLPTFPPPQLEGSALYPLWCLYRGRMLAQNHVEYALPLGERGGC
ncbi:hypothetical protein JL721_12663 [Aureococcus anophagefferens]|nr:hypothetical protein JL721_12663 [Aureococcus anophagefferens]